MERSSHSNHEPVQPNPRDTYVANVLDTEKTKEQKGILFAPYVEFVQGYVSILDTPVSKRDLEFERVLKAKASDLGLNTSFLGGAKAIAKRIYEGWISEKHKQQKKEGALGRIYGHDPEFYLGGEHRNGLGDFTNEDKR